MIDCIMIFTTKECLKKHKENSESYVECGALVFVIESLRFFEELPSQCMTYFEELQSVYDIK